MLRVTDSRFNKYGYLLDGDFSEVVEYLLDKAKMPTDGNLYIRDDEEFKKLDSIIALKDKVFNGKEIEAGYCNGYNSYLNCLEYHNCPEVNVAANDLVLILASQDDIKDGVIDSADCLHFLVKKGEAVVMKPYTFHFSPCKLSKDGFRCAVILTDGTNRDLESPSSDKRLWKENKWLYAHKDTVQAKNGAYIGIVGENTLIKWD